MAANPTHNLEAYVAELYENILGGALVLDLEQDETDLTLINLKLDRIIEAIKTTSWCKGHYTVLTQLDMFSGRCLVDILKDGSKTESTLKLLNVIDKCKKIGQLIESSSLSKEIKQQVRDEITQVKKNLISAFNFCTQQVPKQILDTGAWHGDQIKSEYLLNKQKDSHLNLDSFISQRSNALLGGGEYLVRPCTSIISESKCKRDLYVIEWRSMRTGELSKTLIGYHPESGKYISSDGKRIFDTFEELRLSMLDSKYRARTL